MCHAVARLKEKEFLEEREEAGAISGRINLTLTGDGGRGCRKPRSGSRIREAARRFIGLLDPHLRRLHRHQRERQATQLNKALGERFRL
jgi:hypothetical protein